MLSPGLAGELGPWVGVPRTWGKPPGATVPTSRGHPGPQAGPTLALTPGGEAASMGSTWMGAEPWGAMQAAGQWVGRGKGPGPFLSRWGREGRLPRWRAMLLALTLTLRRLYRRGWETWGSPSTRFPGVRGHPPPLKGRVPGSRCCTQQMPGFCKDSKGCDATLYVGIGSSAPGCLTECHRPRSGDTEIHCSSAGDQSPRVSRTVPSQPSLLGLWTASLPHILTGSSLRAYPCPNLFF